MTDTYNHFRISHSSKETSITDDIPTHPSIFRLTPQASVSLPSPTARKRHRSRTIFPLIHPFSALHRKLASPYPKHPYILHPREDEIDMRTVDGKQTM
ncbi:hypothetical protein QE152_g35152 [Popillia japonica]|uniref:Uncharacterized protein n=1 Tax=Popillia japonica TaxID=7064 RepID=A0AAW1IRB7_POPJA